MTDKLKVAYYLPRFPKLSETFILREMLFLREMGLDIQVFSLLAPRSSATMHQQVDAIMPYVHYSPFLFSIGLVLAQLHYLVRSPFKYFRALFRVIWQTWPEPSTLVRVLAIFPKSVYFAKQVQEMKIVHIHAHFVWLNGFAAQITSDLTGIPFSLHAHAWDIFHRNQESVRRQVERATAVVTISKYHRQYLEELCPSRVSEKVHVVHCGLDPNEFVMAPKTESRVPQILSVGRLIEKKGFVFLIDACARLQEMGCLYNCSIVGDGPLLNFLQERINQHNLQNRVALLGAMNQSAVKKLYRHCDIFVLPCIVSPSGDRDGIPVVLTEAMAMEIPVITTPVSGNPELVCDGESGLMVPERDEQAIAHAIECLINDSSLRERLGKKGRETVLSCFDIHKTAAQMAEIFLEINKQSRKMS